jgi:UDP-glucose 4-epimerase
MIVVTGGAGFIGRNLISKALEKNAEVTVLDREPKPHSFPSSTRLTYRHTDAHRIGRVLPNIKRPDLNIVHLAAETSVRKSIERPLSSVRTNIGMTCAILEFARKVDPQRLVFASSAAIYGEKRGLCHENDLPEPLSPYAASKLAAEYYCSMYSRLYGIPITILRYFNVYGPGQSAQYAGVITNFLTEVSSGRPPTIFGDGKQTRDFIFVRDVVDATLRSLEKKLPNGTIMNIGTGEATTIGSLAVRVLRLLGRQDLRPTHAPSRAGDIKFSRADVSVARQEIGFRPRYSIDRGLKLTIDWLRKSRRI